jgi:transcriptional regulator with XRE-family HTH domain
MAPATQVAERFAGNLLRCRRRAGMSQEELAAYASVHRTEIGKLENAERLPRIDTLVKLAHTLAVSFEDLLAGIVWEVGGAPRVGRFEFSGRPLTTRRVGQ